MSDAPARWDEVPPGAWMAATLAALDGAQVLLSVKDTSGRYLRVNTAMAEWLGRSAAEIAGTTDADLHDAGVAALLRAADAAALAGPGAVSEPHRLERAGTKRDFQVVRMPVRSSAGAGPSALLAVWTDGTAAAMRDQQLQQALAQIEQQQLALEAARREVHEAPLRDRVTGLYQQAQFDDLLRREVDLSSREHREFALASIEIDPLPEGAAADRVLETLGRLLRGNTRAMDASCRIDHRHFAVLLSGVGLATAHSRMESMRRQCATQIVVVDGRETGFTVSMGVASFPHTAHSREELIAAADIALVEARRRGGNHVTLASIKFASA